MRADRGRVLVVDDDRDVLELVSFVLESDGYEVERARDGAEALEAVARSMPALVLLDLKMPVMDGPEFVRRFRAQHGEACPIVVLTAADDARRRAADVGAAAWLGKPFDVDALLALAARLCRTPQPA